MKLVPGQTAPLFRVTDALGQVVDLADTQGKLTFLSFQRFIACPMCNLFLHVLKGRSKSIARQGVRVIVLSESSNETIVRALDGQVPPFPLIGDHELTIYRAYDVETSVLGGLKGLTRIGDLRESLRIGLPKGISRDGALNRLPADFLLDADLTVKVAHYGRDTGDHLSLDALETMLTGKPSPSVAPPLAPASRAQ